MVVDTGLHAFGWSRQRAINYLVENTFMGRQTCKGQVDRYIVWPGQALAYKMGEREIQAVRQRINEEMGGAFDLKQFHDILVKCIGPISMIQKCVRDQLPL